MRAAPFFGDIRMGSHTDRAGHERFLLDTLAERRVEEAPRRRFWWPFR